MPGKHAILSPSSAERWMNCTAAPRLEKLEPDRPSAFAVEGTLAHAMCARNLKKALGRDCSEEDKEIAQYRQYYTPDMDTYVDSYCDFVLGTYHARKASDPSTVIWVEAKLDLSQWIPDGFGTADAVILGNDIIHVIDFKYGKGVKVYAQGNPQMRLYALGALDYVDDPEEYRSAYMSIVQPRLDHYDTFGDTVAWLTTWGRNHLRSAVNDALNGGEQRPGQWCRFCKVKHRCAALADEAIRQTGWGDVETLDKDVIERRILPQLAMIKNWVASVEDYVLQEAINGTRYLGYKLVEGRSRRCFKDVGQVYDRLKAEGYTDEQISEPSKLKSLAEIEKQLGRKKFAEMLGDMVYKPQGAPTLAPRSDSRPEITTAMDAFNQIN